MACFEMKISKLIRQFLRKWPKSEFQAYLGLSGLKNGALERFNGIHPSTQHQRPQLACFEIKISKLIRQFLRKWPKSEFRAYLGLSGLRNGALERFNGIHIYTKYQ